MQCGAKPDAQPKLRALAAGRGRPGLFRSQDGVAALEFAMIAPILVMMVIGLYDLTTALIAWRRVTVAALSIAEIATGEAASVALYTNTLSATQASAAASAVYPYLPDLLRPSPPAFGVTISSIVMTLPSGSTCTTNCTYAAHVAWSGVFAGTGQVRPCDRVQGTSDIGWSKDTDIPSPSTLPSGTNSAAPLLVVDVTYTFRPMFFTFIAGNIAMAQSSYLPPRTGLTSAWIQYLPSGPSDQTVLCTGYPAATTS